MSTSHFQIRNTDVAGHEFKMDAYLKNSFYITIRIIFN
jgi:hypothetical protein